MTKTVYEHLEEDIVWHYGQIDEIRTVRRNLEDVAPQVLNMECKSAATVGTDYISLHAHDNSPLMVDVFNLSDEERMEIKQTKYGSRYAFFRFGDFRVQVSRYSPQRPCTSYRVTHIVNICGDIDKSKYECVEELEPEPEPADDPISF